MNTTKNNKLIAEFMGVLTPENNVRLINPPKGTNELTRIEDSLYHKSWDWLMPVVEKIEELDAVEQVAISKGWDNDEFKRCHIYLSQLYGENYKGKDRVDIENITRIGAVYLAVVEFIKWYNEQQK